MPRANKVDQIDAREMTLSREYLAGALESVTKSKLAAHESRPWLVNPATKSTYNTFAIPKPNPQTGMIKVEFDRAGQPIHGAADDDLSWLVLHDVATNKVYLCQWPRLKWFIRELITNPAAGGGFANVIRHENGFTLNLHLDWAIAQHLIKVATNLKGSYLDWREKKLVTKEDFVHLHCHSEFSLLDGATAIDQVAKRALLNGQPGIALTDHGYCFGSYKHWKACQDVGVKALMGCEIYLVDDASVRYTDEAGTPRRFEHHLTLIAQTAEGWSNLATMLTTGCRDNYYYVPRIDWKMLAAHSAGIICLTGCFKGPVAHYLQTRPLKEGETKLPWWLEKNPSRAAERLGWLKQIYGDRLYGEAMNIDYEQYNACLPELLDMFNRAQVPIVVTNDCHYEKSEDAVVQSMLTRISTQKVDGLGEANQAQGVYFIRQRSEMEAGAAWATPDMFNRTCQIMERCNLTFKKDGYLFPPYRLEEDPDWAAYQELRGQRGVTA